MTNQQNNRNVNVTVKPFAGLSESVDLLVCICVVRDGNERVE